MRVHFPNLQRPKAAAKALNRLVHNAPLALCQRAVACASGYADWHEIEQSHAARPPSALDQALPFPARAQRLADQRAALSDVLGLYDDDALYLAQKIRLTGDGTIDPALHHAVGDIEEGHIPEEPQRDPDGHPSTRTMSLVDIVDREVNKPHPEWKHLYRARWPAAAGRARGFYPFPASKARVLREFVREWVPDHAHAIHAFIGVPMHESEPHYGILAIAMAEMVGGGRWYLSLKHLTNISFDEIDWTPSPTDPIIRVQDTALFPKLPDEIRTGIIERGFEG
jgi:hypothetical protein